MNSKQIELARHALGLATGQLRSYRNHFVAGLGHSDYDDWMEMVENKDAIHRDGSKLPFGGDDAFHLTPQGAVSALRVGERLDPEDFPSLTAHH